MAEATMASLLSAVNPEIPQSDERLVLHNLVASGYIEYNRQGWNRMLDVPASNSLEGDTLESLRIICGQVLSTANIARPFVELGLSNLVTLESEPAVSSRPYAYLRLSTPSFKPDSERDHWADVVMPIEFKKGLEGAGYYAGSRKVVCQMLHIMRPDPRHRFVFGLTIENTNARIWFRDRCDIVWLEIFDIQKDWRTLARLFLRLASASFEELGYSSSCRAVKAELYRYDFVFGEDEDNTPVETVYRPVDVISDLGATILLGHGTLVWKVQKVVNGQPIDGFYALKDLWTHEGCEPEHAVVQTIRDSQKSDQGIFGHALDVIRSGRYFLATGVELNTLPARSDSGIPSETTSRGHRDAKYLNQYPRRQFRMVSREVGTSVYDIRHFPNALRAIQGASKGPCIVILYNIHSRCFQISRYEGLHAMHLAKFNHQNISAGSIIYYQGPGDQEGRGVIMDLEYAMVHSFESRCHDVKMGTAAFMAVEVSYGSYIHRPFSKGPNQAGQIVRTSPPPFHQNALYDYESIWWITIWLLFSLFEPRRPRTAEYSSNYGEVFKSSASTRRLFWTTEDTFEDLSRHLESEPEKDYLLRMEVWAEELKKLYQKSYSAGEYRVLAPKTIEIAYQLGLKWLDELIEIVSTYRDNLAFLSELEAAPSTPPTPELSMAASSDLT